MTFSPPCYHARISSVLSPPHYFLFFFPLFLLVILAPKPRGYFLPLRGGAAVRSRQKRTRREKGRGVGSTTHNCFNVHWANVAAKVPLKREAVSAGLVGQNRDGSGWEEATGILSSVTSFRNVGGRRSLCWRWWSLRSRLVAGCRGTTGMAS